MSQLYYLTLCMCCLSMWGFAASTHGSMIAGDFYARTTYVENYPFMGIREHSDSWADVAAAINDDIELTNDDLVSSDPWFMQHAQAEVDINPLDGSLTITPITMGGIHRFEVWVENILFDDDATLTGIVVTQSGMIPVEPILEYSGQAVRITYESSQYFNFNLAVSDTFQITTVPEPASLSLLVLSGLAMLRRAHL